MNYETNFSGIKGKVIEILSENSDLTAKQIYNKLQRNYATNCTYQALHKTLKQMTLENILLKEKSMYSINSVWANNFKKSAEQLVDKISTKENKINLKEMKDGESKQLQFKGILEIGWFLINQLMIAPNPSKKPGIALWRFCYSVVGLEEKHLTSLKKACKENQWYVFVQEKNKLDQMFGKTLLSYGMKNIKYAVPCATPLSDKMIIGDYIAEITYPSFFRKLWAIQNRLPKKVIEFNLAKHLLYMRELQPAIEVTITKNPKMAEEYQKQYLGK